MVFTGAFSHIQWADEASFNDPCTAQACYNKPFGFEQKISSWNLTQNRIPLSQLDDVRIKTYAYGQTRGSITLDYVLSNPWLFCHTGFKTAGAAVGCGPYTYTWDVANDSPTELQSSLSIEIGTEQGGTDIVRTLRGGIVNSHSLTSTVGEVVRVSTDISYAQECLTTALDACPVSECIMCHIPFTFAHGEFTFGLDCMCCGVVIAEVQDVDLTLNTNPDLLYEVGSSIAASTYRKLFEITGRFRTSWTCNTMLTHIYQQQQDTLCFTTPAQTLLVEQPTATLTFDNGLATTLQRTITITLTGLAFADHNLTIEPNEPVFEELNFQARDIDITALNNTAVRP